MRWMLVGLFLLGIFFLSTGAFDHHSSDIVGTPNDRGILKLARLKDSTPPGTTPQTDSTSSEQGVPPLSPRKEKVQNLAGSPADTIELESINNSQLEGAVQKDIEGSGYTCGSVVGFWQVVGSSSDASLFKVDCGQGNQYQVTGLNGREFIKPWTGVILGR